MLVSKPLCRGHHICIVLATCPVGCWKAPPLGFARGLLLKMNVSLLYDIFSAVWGVQALTFLSPAAPSALAARGSPDPS